MLIDYVYAAWNVLLYFNVWYFFGNYENYKKSIAMGDKMILPVTNEINE